MRAKHGWVLLIVGAALVAPGLALDWGEGDSIGETAVGLGFLAGIVVSLVGAVVVGEKRTLRRKRPRPGLVLPPGTEVGGAAPAGEVPTGRTDPLVRLRSPVIGELRTMAADPVGRLVAAGGDSVVVWSLADPSSPVEVGVLRCAAEVAVAAVSFSSDGRLLAVSYSDQSVGLYDASDALEPIVMIPVPAPRLRGRDNGYFDLPSTVAFAPNSPHLVTVDRDAIIWDLATPTQPHPVANLGIPKNRISSIGCTVAFSRDGTAMAIGRRANVTLWDTTDLARPTRQARFRPGSWGTEPVIRSLAVAPGRGLLATATKTVSASNYGGSITSAVDLWDVTDPTRPERRCRLRQCDTTTKTLPSKPKRDRYKTYTGHSTVVKAVAFSPDGSQLATASADSTAVMWDVTELSEPVAIDVLAFDSEVEALSFGPGPGQLTTGCRDGTVAIWSGPPSQTDGDHNGRHRTTTGGTSASPVQAAP